MLSTVANSKLVSRPNRKALCTCDNVCRRCKGEGSGSYDSYDNSFVGCKTCSNVGAFNVLYKPCWFCDSELCDEYDEQDAPDYEQQQRYLEPIQKAVVIESSEEFNKLLINLCYASFDHNKVNLQRFPLPDANYDPVKKSVNCGCVITRNVQQTIMDAMRRKGERLRKSNGRRAALYAYLNRPKPSMPFGYEDYFEVVVSNNGQNHCHYNFEVKLWEVKFGNLVKRLRMLNLHLTVNSW